MAVGIFVFDVELFTSELVRRRKAQRPLSSQLLDIPGVLFHLGTFAKPWFYESVILSAAKNLRLWGLIETLRFAQSLP